MTRKRRTAEAKAKLVLESFTTSISAAELCRRQQVDASLLVKWREAFIAGGKQALENGHVPREKALERENDELKQLVGELTLANAVLKKYSRQNGEVRQ